jgi:heme-degrading monooxygenase HmoA
MILEVVILDIGKGTCEDFEAVFREASPFIASATGYISHELRRCVEKANRYILLVR